MLKALARAFRGTDSNSFLDDLLAFLPLLLSPAPKSSTQSFLQFLVIIVLDAVNSTANINLH